MNAAPAWLKLTGRVTRAIDIVLRVSAGAVALSLFVAAWHDVSQAYDVWYYHLPFAARLSGIMDASAYAFSSDNAARFHGFPLLAEVVQGALWRITGHIQATNLVALGALFGLVAFMRRVFAVPLHLTLLALLAIPLVHMHATSSYVDLPGNACATMLLLCTYRVIVANEAPSPRVLIGCSALAAAAVNTKFQLVPIVGITAVVLLWFSVRTARSCRAAQATGRATVRRRLAVFAITFPVVFATPIKNTIFHGNPVWPVELHLLGSSLPFRERAYAQSPPHLLHAPRPVRFLRSALEIDNVPIRTQRRWSLDQYAPPDHPSCRMGGYFGAYVAANLLALAFAVWRRRARETGSAAIVFGGATLVAAIVPQSHELRYYMFWMLLLVCLNLVLWTRDGPGGHAWSRLAGGLVAAIALSIVVWSTDAGYLYPSGSTFAEFLAKRSDPNVIEASAPGERLCISREPFTFLYAPAFHPSKAYAVQEATSDADCHDARRVDP